MIAIGMIACPRSGVDLHETVAQLRRGGFREPIHLFCEPGTIDVRPLPDLIVHCNPRRRGSSATGGTA